MTAVSTLARLFDLAREHLIPSHFLSNIEPVKQIQGIALPLTDCHYAAAQQEVRETHMG